MEKYEYKVLMLNHQQIINLESKLNELSNEGWRAVYFDRAGGGWSIVFERKAVPK
ncbi:MAG TPA: hypothetical protein VKR05_00410 [Candidatus Cybelea sp.]|nr:hypothetical protein [Candidatus Cybelea sp.]